MDDQLRRVAAQADRDGEYDAADWIRRRIAHKGDAQHRDSGARQAHTTGGEA